ncbi:MAG: UvrB/UvrC motif-containing protein [Planctomycetota bacterium]|nr:UvrB/UvrC motif-containing protein [Planctomycetota bacterium]
MAKKPVHPDIAHVLESWPHEPGQIQARIIEGRDSEPKVQIRLDLGILQMNMTGRPDALRPFGFESLLEYYQARLDAGHDREGPPGDEGPEQSFLSPSDADERAEAGGTPTADGPDTEDESEDANDDATAAGDSEGDSDAKDADATPAGQAPSARSFPLRELSPADCQALRDEAVQYYHRYVALLALEDFQGVIRDTTRNLRVLDLCRNYAATPGDRAALEQFRPYIMMIRARAAAGQALADNEPKAALFAIDEGLDSLRKHYAEAGQGQMFDQSAEVQMLRGLRESLVPKLPMSQKAELRQRLQKALETENYELAAILRDELKNMKDD